MSAKEKESAPVLDAIVEAAKINVEFARQGATDIVDAVTGETAQRRSPNKRSPRKKAASKAAGRRLSRGKSATTAATRPRKFGQTPKRPGAQAKRGRSRPSTPKARGGAAKRHPN